MSLGSLLIILAAFSLVIWAYLTLFHHGFWRRKEFLPQTGAFDDWPKVTSLTPARNEEAVISRSITSLLSQTYTHDYNIILINDNSDDDTVSLANRAINAANSPHGANIIQAPPLELGWSGKLWALHNGLKSIPEAEQADYYWLSDADITHSPETLARLITHARQNDLAMTSLMVTLNCSSFWEKLIIPAFIYYFQLLYPFSATAKAQHKTAGGAGGCILLRRDALAAIGGLESLKDTLIDDCALAAAVKGQGYNIWLGHGRESRSIRSSAKLADLWSMVSRTAFTQLNFSYLQLFGAILGMFMTYTVPVIALSFGLITGISSGFTAASLSLAALGAVSWALMALTYLPTIRAYKRPALVSVFLPFTAHLFMAMTLHSAWLHLRGSHSGWRGRIYNQHNSQNTK